MQRAPRAQLRDPLRELELFLESSHLWEQISTELLPRVGPGQASPLHKVLFQGSRSPLQGVDVALDPILQAGGGGTLQLQTAAGNRSRDRNHNPD